ncbi:LacI family DNA-binding transcriptional regulator [Andreprevotia chitinilytica]|uniref:LacI family DNA-binding transcriptional regulator n=1 Tax=Andreprevotia chitinilytica TaxID=396808 RepID=UPI00054FCD1B|nr:LacI family DNA-binding transcriptional regulator [Andreprevotia chitinilytica]
MVTLAEVAKHADVTPATVSNVLRNRDKVRPKTVERVLAAIKELGYRPNLTARALAEGRSATLALMVSNIANPFYPEFVLEAERAARRAGQFLLVCNTDDDAETSRAYLNQIAGTLAEGVLVMNTELDMAELCQSAAGGTPLVLCMWENPAEPPTDLPCVAVDFPLAGRLAAEHLLTLEHRDIGIIVGNGCGGLQSARYQGFLNALTTAGVTQPESRIVEVQDTLDEGFKAATTLLENDPNITALFATNDLMAIGAMQAALVLGKRVPEDVSVIGITDIALAHQMRPSLSTVAIDTHAIAGECVKLLLEIIKDPGNGPRMVLAPAPQLVARDSTGPAPRPI